MESAGWVVAWRSPHASTQEAVVSHCGIDLEAMQERRRGGVDECCGCLLRCGSRSRRLVLYPLTLVPLSVSFCPCVLCVFILTCSFLSCLCLSSFFLLSFILFPFCSFLLYISCILSCIILYLPLAPFHFLISFYMFLFSSSPCLPLLLHSFILLFFPLPLFLSSSPVLWTESHHRLTDTLTGKFNPAH